MLAQCPHCRTVFAVAEAQLKAAGGRVRCGHCFNPFNALKHLVDDGVPGETPPPEGPPAPGEVLRQEALLPELGMPEPEGPERRPNRGTTPGERQRRPGAKPQATTSQEPELPTGPVPELLAADVARLGRSRAGWLVRAGQSLAIAALLLSLGIQYAWFLPEDLLYRYPIARSWLQQGFAWMGRRLPEAQDLSRVYLLSRDIRIHADYTNVLQVTATLVNRAAFVQAFPRVKLTLFDVNGGVTGSRILAPLEYLDPSIDPATGMVPRRPVQFRLSLVAPAPGAVSYEFQFL